MKMCPKCGWDNDNSYNFCLGCGYQLPMGDSSFDPPTDLLTKNSNEGSNASAFVSGKPSDMGEAVSSGANKSDDAIAETTAQVFFSKDRDQNCPQCDGIIPTQNRFCGSCGYRLLDPEPPPPPPPKVEKAPPPPPKPSAKLVLLLPNGQEGGTYPLKPDRTQIGRKQGNILFLDDPFVSPLHATFTRINEEEMTISDEKSLNGLFIRLNGQKELQNNDILLLGKQLLRFEKIEQTPENYSGNLLDRNTPEWGSPYGPYWGRLVQLIANGQVGNAVLLGGEQVDLGRERGQITFPGDRFISGLHARVAHQENRFFLEDLGSRNGTFMQIRDSHTVRHNDILIIGEQLLRVELSS